MSLNNDQVAHIWANLVEVAKKKLARARVDLGLRLQGINGMIDRMDAYSKHFKLGYRVTPKHSLEEISAKFKKIIAKERVAAKKEREAKRGRAIEGRDVWISRGSTEMLGWPGYAIKSYFGFDYLRLSLDEKELETTGRARAPVAHAIKLWPLVKAYCEKGREFVANGKQMHVGHFAISRISKKGVITAGCHKFEFSEFQRMAKVLGLEV